jgi:hypothetical protein
MRKKTEGNAMCAIYSANDQVVITRKVEDAIYMGRKLEEYEKWGLKTNYGKIECLGTDHSEEFQINGNTIQL